MADSLWAEKLLERRLALGLTQREVALAAGVSQQAVSYIERGVGIPRVTTLVRLSRVLGTDLATLFPPET
jgi:transcriptional regulator with XRE-family HTH domain